MTTRYFYPLTHQSEDLMAKKEKALNQMTLEEVREKLGWAVVTIRTLAQNRQDLEITLTTPERTERFFAAINDATESNSELARRFAAPANCED